MISIEREGRVATVTLRRGPRRNALSMELLSALHAALGEVAASDADAVIVAGEGPVFSAGHDLAEVAGATLEDIHALLDCCTAVMGTLRAMPQVSVARVHGLATAAGCQLVASCDLAVASTRLGSPYPAARAAGSAPRRWSPSVGRSAPSGRSSSASSAIRSTPTPLWHGAS
ncbi:MAG: enoyl-CoA hydratase-related protein [Acidimicrobiales bacterium]